jgi:hypothetical protein
MNATYRCKRFSALLCVASIVGGSVFVGVLWLALQEPISPNAPPYAWAVLAVLFSFPILLLNVGGMYALVGAIRHRLTITGDCVESVNAFTTTQIDLTQVHEAKWRVYGTDGGRLVLKCPSNKLTLDFTAYAKEHSRELIKFLRLRLPEPTQRGWDKYWQRHWRLFDEPDPAQREYFAEETRRLRWRLGAWCFLGIAVGLPVVVAAHCWAGNWDALRKLPVILLLLPLYFLPVFLVRADRCRISERFARPKMNKVFILGVAVFGLTYVLYIAFAALHIPGRETMSYIGMAVAIVLILPGAYLQDRLIRPTNAKAAKAAEREYMRPPSPTKPP